MLREKRNRILLSFVNGATNVPLSYKNEKNQYIN